MEKNDILELTRLMQEGGGLESDFAEVMEGFRNMLEKKYVKKIHAAARARKEEAAGHPPKEVTLLRAMRAFADEGGRTQMDNMIQAMLFMNTMQNINKTVADINTNEPRLLQAMSSGTASDSLPQQNDAQLAGLLLTLALADII